MGMLTQWFTSHMDAQDIQAVVFTAVVMLPGMGMLTQWFTSHMIITLVYLMVDHTESRRSDENE